MYVFTFLNHCWVLNTSSNNTNMYSLSFSSRKAPQVPSVRKDIQFPRKPGETHPGPHRREAVRVQRVRQEVQGERRA